MTKTTFILGFCSGMLALAPLSSPAQPADSLVEQHHRKMLEELKLNADQKEKLKAVHTDMREKGKALFEQMKGIREKVRTELLKDKPSQQALDGFTAQLADIQKQLIQQRHAHLLQAKAILTKEQFSKLLSRDWMQGPGGKPGKMGKGRHGRGPGADDSEL